MALTVLMSAASCHETASEPQGVVGSALVPLDPVAPVLSGVVATVADHEIYADELRWELARNATSLRTGEATEADKLQALDRLVETELMAQRARSLGLDQSIEVRRAIRTVLADAYQRERVRSIPAGKVSPDAVRQDYEADLAAYEQPARARGSVVVLKIPRGADEAGREAVRERAAQLRKRLIASDAGPTSFAEVAMQFSEDPQTRRRAGDMGWLPEGGESYRWSRPVIEALFALGVPGSISPLIEDEREVVFVRLAEATPAAQVPLAAVAEDIRGKLERAARAEQVAAHVRTLREGVPIRIDEAALSEVVPAQGEMASGARPPSFPVGLGAGS